MKEKITFPTLVANLAIRSGKSKKQCEDFLRELFATIEQTLASGETLKIKNLGTFKIVKVEARKSVDVNTGESIEIPSHNKVTFIPAKELSDEVNAPFSMFESVEIMDQITNIPDKDTDLKDEDITEENVYSINEDLSDGSHEESQADTPSNESPDNELSIDINTDELPEEELSNNEISDQEQTNQDITTSDITTNDETSDYVESVESDYHKESVDENYPEDSVTDNYTEEQPKRHRFLIGFISGIACSLLCIGVGLWICYNYCDNISNIFTKAQEQQAQSVSEASTPNEISANTKADVTEKTPDSITSKESVTEMNDEMVPTQASDNIVYDTISKTRYLTTMAKEHYGNYNLWPYIYIENQKILGHPDRIRPGTQVIVPPLSKYNVDPNSKKDIDKAKKMGIEIYSRYQ